MPVRLNETHPDKCKITGEGLGGGNAKFKNNKTNKKKEKSEPPCPDADTPHGE